MADEVRRIVGDYVTLQRGITYNGNLVGKPGPALLGLGSIEPGGGFRANKFQTFGGECPQKIMLVPGDIYVALKGATKDGSMVGSVARLPKHIPSGRLTQDTARLDFIGRDSEATHHLYWVLRTPQYRQYCGGRLTGSAAASFSRDDFLAYPVPPITDTSKALVNLFEAIEAKIEFDRGMNETLEAIAGSIFESRSRDENWAELKLADVCSIYDGPHATPKLADAGPIFLGISNLANGLLNLSDTNHVTEEDFIKWTRRVTPSTDDVVFSYETRLGQAAIIPRGLRCCLGRRMGLLRPKAGRTEGVVLLRAYLTPEFQEAVRRHTVLGSTVDRIPLKDMGFFPIRLPQWEDLTWLAGQLRLLRTKVEHNEENSRTLATLRDMFLPKLISGELRIKDAESLVGSAA